MTKKNDERVDDCGEDEDGDDADNDDDDDDDDYSPTRAWEGVGVSEKHLGEIELREETVGIRILARRRVEDMGPEITGRVAQTGAKHERKGDSTQTRSPGSKA